MSIEMDEMDESAPHLHSDHKSAIQQVAMAMFGKVTPLTLSPFVVRSLLERSLTPVQLSVWLALMLGHRTLRDLMMATGLAHQRVQAAIRYFNEENWLTYSKGQHSKGKSPYNTIRLIVK